MNAEIFKAHLDQINLGSMFLFCSFARGNANKDSDIYLFVVSNYWTDNIIEETMSLMRVRWIGDLRFEPHPNRSNKLDENPFVRCFRQEMKKEI